MGNTNFESMFRKVTEVGTTDNINFESTPSVNEEFIQKLDIVLLQLRDTLIRKNHDYGNSFSKQYKKYGLTSYLIRDDDKTSRLESLQTKGSLVSESIQDTVLDKAGYATLLLIELLEETK